MLSTLQKVFKSHVHFFWINHSEQQHFLLYYMKTILLLCRVKKYILNAVFSASWRKYNSKVAKYKNNSFE